MSDVKRLSIGGGTNRKVLAALAVTAVLLLPNPGLALEPPDPLEVLFVANGWYDQEDDIEAHLLDLGHEVTVKKDYQVYGSTDLSVYDLIVITEFAPNLSYSALDNIDSSEVPVLIVEYWDFWYSYRLGLTTTDSCGYFGTNHVESVSQGIDDFSWYVGREPEVYTSSYTIYGIFTDYVSPGVEKLYYSSEGFEEIAVLVDASKKMAATGIYDTTRYTAEAWRIFDRMIQTLVPARNAWDDNPWEMPQALSDSGILDYVEEVNRHPERYDAPEVRERLWKDLSRWGLLDLSDFVSSLVKPAYPGFEILQWLEFSAPDLPHPERCGYDNQRWLLGAHWAKSEEYGEFPQPGETPKWCTDYYYPDDQATWPGNIHPDVSDQDYSGIPWNSNKVGGVDMGASARLWGRTYFYMGDTWRRGGNVGQFYDQDPDWCEFPGFWCSEDAVRNDAITFSVDDDPTDGIDLTVFSEATGDASLPVTYRGIGIPGVHNFAPDDMWDSSYPVAEPQFTTTSSAATVAVPFPSGDLVYSIPMVVVTYTSASSPEWDHTYNLANNNCTPIDTDDCAVPHARKTPKTHIACSYDGVHFFACYQDLDGMLIHPVPLSESGFHYQDCQNRVAVYGPNLAGRFLGSSLVEVGPADLKSMCVGIGGNPPYAPDSQMCELYDEELGYGGLLVYGQARPTPKSPLFIAFIKASEIGLVDQQGKPEIWYFTDEDPSDPNPELPSWSRDEVDATPLPDADWDEAPCDQLSETSRGCETLNPPRHYPPENCHVSSDKPSFGAFPLSLALVRDGTEDQNGVQRPEVLIAYKKGAAVYRTAPVSAPWDISGEKNFFLPLEKDCTERVDGYGNHIIHGNPDIYFQFENGELSFWHIVSTWNNVNPACCPGWANDERGPYGTYTRKETISWPPTE